MIWPYPRIVAHRGGGTLAPENTIAGVRCGMQHGFRAIEFDVMLAGDGVGVVMHDPVLGRTVAAGGNVNDYDARALAQMDAGSWLGEQFRGETVPLFIQFAGFCKANGVWMNIEIKPVPGYEAETGRVIAEATRGLFGAEVAARDWARVPLLSSFSPTALAAARHAVPELPRGLLIDRLGPAWESDARALGALAIHTNQLYLTRELAQAVKAAGFGLFCYTVNDPARALTLVGWGVDGFCTDRIDLIGPDFA